MDQGNSRTGQGERKTVQYDEQVGVLPRPARNQSGYRDYGVHAVERLARESLLDRGRTDEPADHDRGLRVLDSRGGHRLPRERGLG